MGNHEFDAELNWWSSTPRTSSSTGSTAFDGSSSSTTCSAQIRDGAIDSPSNMQIPGFPMDWNQSLLRSSHSGRVEPTLHAVLQEPLNCHHHQQHQFHHIASQEMILQGLFEPELKPQQQTTFDQRFLNCEALGNSTNYGHGSSSNLLAKFPQFLSSSPWMKQISSANSLQFSSNASFWNSTPNAVSYPPTVPVQFGTGQSYEQNKPTCTSIPTTTKTNFDSVHKKTSSGNSSSEPALKKTRIETPSPLPTFKVRKEKLGDRITALQQLVSPFGKTDTASVLHEAIEYIKFLHDQVNVLTTPYLKNGHPMEHQKSSQGKQDLRSKGLCLVPIESTYPVASYTTADFWTPTFGGTFR